MNTTVAQSRLAEVRRSLEELETAILRLEEGGRPPHAAVQAPLNTLAQALSALRGALGQEGDPAPAVDVAVPRANDIRFLEATFRCLVDPVITIDDNGLVVLLNSAAETMLGWSAREATGVSIEEVMPLFDERNPSLRYSKYDALLAGESAGQGNEFKALLRCRSGTERVVLLQGSRIADEGKDIGTVLTVRDISRSYFLEEEVLKIRKLESVGVLAGGIAHDFNNLLTGITTNLFMARMSVVGNNEACSLISEAEKAAFKATTLTKQLLSFARGGPSVKEVTSIKQLIQDTVGFCLSGSNVDYRLDLPDDLQPVEIDKGQIDQVLNNLILNAAQAMPHGGTVTISARNVEISGGTIQAKALPLPPGKYVEVAIHDEGTGIPREHLEKIFDPYFSTRDDGTGLGLSTAYAIVKRHGGHIYVESDQGKGSTFIFLLPIPAIDDTKQKNNDLLMKGTGRVLIMDDDVIVRTVVETLLKKAGYTPVCVTNGEQALEYYREALATGNPFTVTIMDLTIPGGMGGKETVKRLRDIDENAKVIVFSGYSNDPIFSNYKEYGFDGVLSKPFSIDDFMKTIAQVLKSS